MVFKQKIEKNPYSARKPHIPPFPKSIDIIFRSELSHDDVDEHNEENDQ